MKVLIAIATLFMFAVLLLAATYTDDFNRADSGDPGANWSEWGGTTSMCGISGNTYRCTGTDGGIDVAWVGSTIAADQYVQFVVNPVTLFSTDLYAWVALRVDTATNTKYTAGLKWDQAAGVYKISMNRDVNGGSTTIVSLTTVTFSPGDTLKFTVTGSNPVALKAYINSTEVATYDDTSGDRIASGRVGMGAYLTDYRQDLTFDNFEAGEIGATARRKAVIVQ